LALVQATRVHPDLVLGCSPRGALAFAAAARAWAFVQGREYVIPDDVKALAVGVLAHRLIVKSQASLREIDPDAIVREIVSQVPVGQPSPLSATAG
jgi:MoxR-like ATPase